jgi:hypothetical protein
LKNCLNNFFRFFFSSNFDFYNIPEQLKFVKTHIPIVTIKSNPNQGQQKQKKNIKTTTTKKKEEEKLHNFLSSSKQIQK